MRKRALLYCIELDMKERYEADRDQFMKSMIAAHPTKAKDIMELFKQEERNEEEAQIEAFIPETHEELEQVMADLSAFGIHLTDF